MTRIMNLLSIGVTLAFAKCGHGCGRHGALRWNLDTTLSCSNSTGSMGYSLQFLPQP